MKRSIIFWDYSNFTATLQALCRVERRPLRDFDLVAFTKALTTGQDLVKIYFVVSTGSGDPPNLEKFFTWVDFQPFFYVKSFERVERGEESSIEKQVDVYIASQMVALAYENAYDVAILVSGDQDFVPAVETVQQKGKVVMVVSSEAGISNLLKRKADRAVLIDAPGDLNFKGFLKNATSEA